MVNESHNLRSLCRTFRESAMEEPVSEGENQKLLKVLEALKLASHELQSNPSPKSTDSNFSAIKALLELETEAKSILLNDPSLSTLSDHLASLKSTVESLQKSQSRHGLKSFLGRRISIYEISRIAGSIEAEIQAWIDRESIENLGRLLNRSPPISSSDVESLVGMLIRFVERLSQGFNRKLQELVLKSKIFTELEWVLCNPKFPVEVREHVGFAIAELIRFNKDVFVGQVLMGETIHSLISVSTPSSLGVICSLIRSIKSPMVDEIDFNGQIVNIVDLLDCEDLGIRVMAMNCVLEIGYYGRKEAIDAMLEADLIKKLVELQRCEVGEWEEKDGDERHHPFESCVAKFAVQLEVGEGLRQREKRGFKQEILKRVREVCVSDAVAATILAEVLWGSSP